MSEDVAKRITQYLKCREKINELKLKHKEELKPYQEAMYTLEQIMLTHLAATGTDSCAVRGIGTAYSSVKKSATIADKDGFQRFVIGGEHWDLIDIKANAPAVKDFIDAHGGALPPGLNYSEEIILGVRKAT